jgi:hypothetical protein
LSIFADLGVPDYPLNPANDMFCFTDDDLGESEFPPVPKNDFFPFYDPDLDEPAIEFRLQPRSLEVLH